MGSALTLVFTDKLQEDEPARTFSSPRVRMWSGGRGARGGYVAP